MKKYFFVLIIILNSKNLIAQNPINVTISTICSNISGIYNFDGVINGKNNYSHLFNIDGEDTLLSIGYDSVKWILYKNNNMTEPGYINTNDNGLIPPFTGWTNYYCFEGSMIISENLSVNGFNFDNDLTLFPNPASDSFSIKENNLNTSIIKFIITESTGRILKIDNYKKNEKIDVENLPSGIYLIQIFDKSGLISNKKLQIN